MGGGWDSNYSVYMAGHVTKALKKPRAKLENDTKYKALLQYFTSVKDIFLYTNTHNFSFFACNLHFKKIDIFQQYIYNKIKIINFLFSKIRPIIYFNERKKNVHNCAPLVLDSSVATREYNGVAMGAYR